MCIFWFCNCRLIARRSECCNVYFDLGNEVLVPILLQFDVYHATVILTQAKLSTEVFKDMFLLCARARIFKPSEVIFLAHICFQSVGKNVQVQLMKLTLFYCIFTKSARALLLRFLQNQKMHIIYIILSLHAKNQPPRTIPSYV